MNKSDIIRQIAKRYRLPVSLIKKVVDGTFETIMLEVLNGDKVSISGFGTFQAKDLEEKRALDPNTGEVVSLPKRQSPAFTPSSIFKNGFKNVIAKGGDKRENGS